MARRSWIVITVFVLILVAGFAALILPYTSLQSASKSRHAPPIAEQPFPQPLPDPKSRSVAPLPIPPPSGKISAALMGRSQTT